MFMATLGACRCFSVCTVKAATEFLNAIPSTVPAGSFDDTWLPYLRTVYGHNLSLPFDLTHLNFFFHHSRRWATQHAGTAWPRAEGTLPIGSAVKWIVDQMPRGRVREVAGYGGGTA